MGRGRRFFVAATVAVMLAACGREGALVTPPEPAATVAPPAPQGGVGATTSALCIEVYTPETLPNRTYAFDGTVAKIEPAAAPEGGEDRVTFTVTKWFKGGEGTTVVRRATGFSNTTSVGNAHAVGERLLVAGDEDFVWECGFTQAYDAKVAADWERTFSEGGATQP